MDIPDLDITSVIENNTAEESPEIPALIIAGYANAPDTVENLEEQHEWLSGTMSNVEKTAAVVKLYNATVMAKTKGLDIQFAYKNIDTIMSEMFPMESISEETFLGRIDVTFKQRQMQNEMDILYYHQLRGDSSPQTEEQIQFLKAEMPDDSRLDEFTAKMKESGLLGKFFLAMGALPYTFASQMPMWISQIKYGAAGAAVAGLSTVYTGAAVLPAMGTGFLYGAGVYEYMIESGSSYGVIKEKAKAAGADLDMDRLRFSTAMTAGIVTMLDVGTFGKMAGSVVNQTAKIFAMKLTSEIWNKVAFGALGKKVLNAYLLEGGTEGTQEVLTSLNEITTSVKGELAGQPAFSDLTGKDLLEEFYVAGALAGPMAAFGVGAMTTLTIVRAQRNIKANVSRTVAELEASLKTEEDVDVSVESTEVDIAETEIVSEPVPEAPGEPVELKIEPEEAAVDSVTSADEFVEPAEAVDKLKKMKAELDEALGILKGAENESFGNTEINSVSISSDLGDFVIGDKKIAEDGITEYRIIDPKTGVESYMAMPDIAKTIYGDMTMKSINNILLAIDEQGGLDIAYNINKVETIQADILNKIKEQPVAKVEVDLLNMVETPVSVGSIGMLINKGIKVATQNYYIKGETYIGVVIQDGPGKSTRIISKKDLSNVSGLSELQINNRIKKAEAQISFDYETTTFITESSPVKAMEKAVDLQEDGVVFSIGSNKYTLVTEEGAALASHQGNSNIVGYIKDGQMTSTFNMRDAVDAFGWKKYFSPELRFSAPDGVVLHKETDANGNDSYFYYSGEIDDTHTSMAKQYSDLQNEAMLKEQEEVAPIDDGEVAIAGGEVGVQEVSNTLALIDQVDERYHPVNEKGIRYLWDKHKRINYSNKVARTRRQLAQLFSIFRHPNVEHVHVVYTDIKGRIISNTCESSGMAASTALNQEAIGLNMEMLGAEKFYVVHNHPSGDTKTSDGDKQIFSELKETYGGQYAGAVVLNHDHFSWTEPGQDEFVKQKYNPKRKYDRPPTHEYTKSEVADIVTDRGTAIFVMSGIRKVRAVVSPTRNLTAQELYQVIRQYGGSFYNIASDSQLTRQHYVKVGKAVQGTELAQMGLVMAVNKNGVVTTDFKGILSGDSFKMGEQSNMALWEEEDAFFDVKPRTVSGWVKYWDTIKEMYNIVRPSGIYARIHRVTRVVKGPQGETYIKANFLPAADSIQFDMTVSSKSGASPPLNVKYEVVQGDEGINVGMVSELELDESQKDFLDDQAAEIAQEIFSEGERFNMDDLDLSDPVADVINDFTEHEGDYKVTPIVKVMEESGLKDKMMTLSEELRNMDNRGLSETNEYKHIQQNLYRMGQMTAALEGMSSQGLNRVKRLASDLAHSKFSPQAMKEGIELKIDELQLRLPLTKKQQRDYAKIKDLPKEKLSKKERRFVEWAEKPGLESLGIEELNELKDALMHVWKMRYAITKFAYEGGWLSMKKGIADATKEFGEYNPNRIKDVNPANAAESKAFDRVRSFTKNFIVSRQMQFFFIVEHLAGPNSIANQILYRNLNAADTRTRKYRHRLQDMYHNELMKNGIDGEVLAKWANEEIELEGVTFLKSQVLEIYLHSLQEDNLHSLRTGGMYYSDFEGGRHRLDPAEIDFDVIINYAKNDKTMMQVVPAFRKVYDSLGKNIKTVYETMFGREWNYVENYFPKKVAREFFQKGQDEVSTVNLKDENGQRISIAKDYLIDREQQGAPLELSKRGAFETLSYSIEQESKFIHMEMAFFQASKLLYDPDFKAKIVNTKGMGEAYWNLLESGIQDWAGRRQDLTRTWDKVILGVRKQATRAGLGYNPFTASKAAISWFYCLRYLDWRSAQEGLRRAGLKGARESLMAKSAVFRDRVMGGSLPEVHDLLEGKDVTWAEHGMPKKGTKGYDNAMFWMLTTVDAKTVTAVMEGAIYQAELAFREGKMTEKMVEALGFKEAALQVMSAQEKADAAVAYAEYVLQRTQPDFRPQSRNAFQRGTPIERLASVFGSFVTITHGMAWDIIHRIQHEGLQGVGVKDMIVTLSLMMVVTAGNEGVERLKKWALKRDQSTFYEIVAKAMFNNTFIIRDINEMVLAKIKYGSYAGKGGTDSFVRGLDLGVTGAVMALDGLFDDDDESVVRGMKYMLESIGTFGGAPVAAGNYGVDLLTKRVLGAE